MEKQHPLSENDKVPQIAYYYVQPHNEVAPKNKKKTKGKTQAAKNSGTQGSKTQKLKQPKKVCPKFDIVPLRVYIVQEPQEAPIINSNGIPTTLGNTNKKNNNQKDSMSNTVDNNKNSGTSKLDCSVPKQTQNAADKCSKTDKSHASDNGSDHSPIKIASNESGENIKSNIKTCTQNSKCVTTTIEHNAKKIENGISAKSTTKSPSSQPDLEVPANKSVVLNEISTEAPSNRAKNKESCQMQNGECWTLKDALKYAKWPKLLMRDEYLLEQLASVVWCFKEKVTWLYARLENERKINMLKNNNAPLLAKICYRPRSESNIGDNLCEHIRQELIAWIKKYQHEEQATPIFYSFANHGTHVTVVCQDLHAYECVTKCITEVASARPDAAHLSVSRIWSTDQFYCYDAFYDGIVENDISFLAQIAMHRSALKSNHWIFVHHEVSIEKKATYCIFLLDLESALRLTYHYNNKLFICMQWLTFTPRASIPMDTPVRRDNIKNIISLNCLNY